MFIKRSEMHKRGKSAHIIYSICRIFFGGLFVYASIDKIIFLSEFVKIVQNYDILPPTIAKYFAFSVPFVELVFGFLLISNVLSKEISAFFSFLLIIFIIAIIIRALNGNLGNCGCFSIKAPFSESLFIILLRDSLLLFLGLYLFLGADKYQLQIHQENHL